MLSMAYLGNALHPDYNESIIHHSWRSRSMYSDNRRSQTPSSLRRKLPQTPDEQHYSMPNSPRNFDTNVPAGFYSSRLHRKVYEIRSSEFRQPPTTLDWSSTRSTPLESPKKKHNQMRNLNVARSQSFRHRSRPAIEVKRNVFEEVTNERRRSTPTVSRRCSLQRSRVELPRTDVWPEPKQMSEVEERFLRLPDSEDYTRVRQFKIDEKGAVVSRGDSFRRKRHNKSDNSPSPFPLSETDSPRNTSSRSDSIASSAGSAMKLSGERSSPGEEIIPEAPSTSHLSYKIYILGQEGSGKSSLISQFITSEYRNAFADEVDDCTNIVSICIGGAECELTFFEADPTTNDEWKNEQVEAYVLIYSIDSKTSFRTVMNTLEDLREEKTNIPIILAGNKMDLERKRTVAANDVTSIAHQHNVAHFEISVALNHDVDELLVGIVAEIKESIAHPHIEQENSPITSRTASFHESEDFRAAIRRFSQRKKKQMGVALVEETSKCANFSPGGIFAKLRQWRKTKC